jgi:hypothetical protein
VNNDPYLGGPYYGTAQGAVACFLLRGRALLSLNRPDEAMAEFRQVERIADSVRDEATLNGGLTRISIWTTTIWAAEEGLQGGKWRVNHLAELAAILTRPNHLAAYKHSLSSDRVCGNFYFDRAMADHEELASLINMGAFGRSNPDPKFVAAVAIAPHGWVRRAQVKYNRRFDRELSDIDSEHALIAPQLYRETDANRAAYLNRWNPKKHVLEAVSPVTALASFRAFELHSRVEGFVVISALWRYREANGGLPVALTELVPDYLAAIPHDLMDGQPIRYRRLEDGGCRVWSIGKDRIDDGGVAREPRRMTYDWVSELPPLPAAD